ncbi:enoyl-CoA hydratase/isomerase family protein [Paracoccus sp. Z118]|uniref:oxepin-CoA hydrolase, alternative type n=1 Tax=Paracoccus sp. Z118 TaxID=2851017 RepID=UPI001C2C68FD|nr:enoyl-CoA hydratase family protein [Paracoccus sp. Z118]MBV0891799.1 enoyl-CoA hydratase/isomerase family protein [Paracoccus sp. Z118]
MSASCEIIDKGDRLVVVNRNAARRNALSPELYAGMREALAQAAAEPRIAAVIVTGEGGFFCAGGDLNVLQKAGTMTEDQRRAEIEDLAALIRQIMACPRPVIAAVEGGAAGAGFSLAFACDLIVAEAGAKFTAAYVNAGLIPDGGLSASLMQALPPALAAELMLLGRPISAERLHQLGAVNELAQPGQAMAAADLLADRLASGPAEAQAAIKSLLSGARTELMERQLAAETPLMACAMGAAEAAEGMAAFLTKRAPDYPALRTGGKAGTEG